MWESKVPDSASKTKKSVLDPSYSFWTGGNDLATPGRWVWASRGFRIYPFVNWLMGDAGRPKYMEQEAAKGEEEEKEEDIFGFDETTTPKAEESKTKRGR